VSTADDPRVQEARRRLASVPPDADLARMPATELLAMLTKIQAAAWTLDIYLREAEGTRRLNAIRDLLAHFDWEFHDRQLALEAIDRIAGGGQA
jgi:hypothetical protein